MAGAGADDAGAAGRDDVEGGRSGPDDVYDPSAVEVTRGRQQGLGVGARDLQMQQDPSGGDDETKAERLMRATAPTSGQTGLPDTEAQKVPGAEPSYPAADGEDAATAGDDRPDSQRRA